MGAAGPATPGTGPPLGVVDLTATRSAPNLLRGSGRFRPPEKGQFKGSRTSMPNACLTCDTRLSAQR